MTAIHIDSLQDESPARRCMDLIARCAPRFMKCGGGPLPREELQRRRKLEYEQRERIIALARGGMTGTEIARTVGTTQSVVCKFLHKLGIRPRDGRAGRISQRRAAPAI